MPNNDANVTKTPSKRYSGGLSTEASMYGGTEAGYTSLNSEAQTPIGYDPNSLNNEFTPEELEDNDSSNNIFF